MIRFERNSIILLADNKWPSQNNKLMGFGFLLLMQKYCQSFS